MTFKEIEALITKYGINPIEYGPNAGKVTISNLPSGKEREALFTKLPDVKKYFAGQKAKKDAEIARRKANVGSIPGFKEIVDYRNALAEWRYKFEKSFDNCGGLGVGPKPKGNEKELLKKYPQAAAYLRVEEEAQRANYELAAIGEKALDAFEDCPSNWKSIVATMDKEIEDETQNHLWD